MIRKAKTENGWVRGIEAADPRITAFKGVPFAAPPVKENRWRKPMPCEDWDGVKDCFRFAPISVQDVPGIGDIIYNREWHVDPDIEMDEDCLYLNIWTGAKDDTERLPVLIWYFGGGLQWGYPAEMEFDGERLARRGVVVVSVNYRINVFGFLTHPEIVKEQPDAPANFGLLDQQAGLNWVIRNIAAFGGDPENITIAGQSAGAGSVLTQMANPDNFGRFQKAVLMSGIIGNAYEKERLFSPMSLPDAEKYGEEFFEFIGAKDLNEARSLDAFYIRDKYAEFRSNHPLAITVNDGRFITGDPQNLFVQGKCADVPVMAGNTGDEFHISLRTFNREELEEKAKKVFGNEAGEFLKALEADEAGRGPEVSLLKPGQMADVNSVEIMAKSFFSYEKRENGSRNCYYYCFDPDIPGSDNPGTFHSVDLWFFFETLAKCIRPFTGRHYDLSRQMCNYWANFIKTGDPNGNDADGTPLPLWKPYTKDNPYGMMFLPGGAVPDDSRETPLKQFLIDNMGKRLSRD